MRSDIVYEIIKKELEKFPLYVKITVFIDACYSGHMVQSFQSLAPGRCGLTLIASADPDSEVCAGFGDINTATEDFVAAGDEDRDQDGVRGDLRDRFEYMAERTFFVDKEQTYYHFPEDTPWCSLDGAVGDPPTPWVDVRCGDGVIHLEQGEECDTGLGGAGGCTIGYHCNDQCRCEPCSVQCADDQECGDDGCGGTCGVCDGGLECVQG